MITICPSFFHPFVSIHSITYPSCFPLLSCSVCSILGIHLEFPPPPCIHSLAVVVDVAFVFLHYSLPRIASRNPNGSRLRLLSSNITNNRYPCRGTKYPRVLSTLILRNIRAVLLDPYYHHLPLKDYPRALRIGNLDLFNPPGRDLRHLSRQLGHRKRYFPLRSSSHLLPNQRSLTDGRMDR